MKLAVFEPIPTAAAESFYAEVVRGKDFGCTWHFHPEYELTLTLKANGYRVVGDDISSLEEGDLVLLGADLPHDWQQEKGIRRTNVHSIVVQFREGFLGNQFIQAPELERIRKLLARSAAGLQVNGRARDRAAELMLRIVAASGMRRLLLLLEILQILTESKSLRTIASPGFRPSLNAFDEARMRRVAGYIIENLASDIYLRDLAKVAGLSEGAFTRFFRTRTGKTVPVYLAELRIGRACRMLMETDRPITEIAFACGYRNLSNFNRQFRRLKQLSPREYRRQLITASSSCS